MAQVDALLDLFGEDPGATIATAHDEGELDSLFDGLLGSRPATLDWRHLIWIANELTLDGDRRAFERLATTAQTALSRAAFARAILSLEELYPRLAHFEEALRRGTFANVVQALRRADVLSLFEHATGYAIALHPFYYSAKIEHHLNKGDLKRAFDALVEAVQENNKMGGRGMPHFKTWVERVWQAHRDRGFVQDLTEDPEDWRNRTDRLTILYGQVRTGFRTTKPKTPKIEKKVLVLSMVWLWGPYTVPEDLPDWLDRHTPPVLLAECGFTASGLGWRTYPVRPPGNMLRDLVRYWHVVAKKRKLQSFCTKYGLPMPEWPTS